MKLTSVEPIERSQLILGVRQTVEMTTRVGKTINGYAANGWVRVLSLRHLGPDIELTFGTRRPPRNPLIVRCRKVRELSISDLDGGGLRMYSGSHPAARQFTAPVATLRWRPSGRVDEAMAAVSRAHVRLVDHWIPLERYAALPRDEARTVIWKGPQFCMRAYARALRATGLACELTAGRQPSASQAMRVLHFGESHVVARSFEITSKAT